jgi:4-hydroxy-4-methyl-2-oxoglutarate aldolase
VRVIVGGREVTPGDLIIGDDDGLVVLSPVMVRKHLRDAQAKLALEAEWTTKLASGWTVAQTFALPTAE